MKEFQKFLADCKDKTFKVEGFVVVNNKRIPILTIVENSRNSL